jgi:class 3 adenylate cyclase/ligand-binding sensor domain-containing protein
MLRIQILVGYLLFMATMSVGQEALDFEVFGFEDGLSHRNVQKTVQDKTGFIWVATVNGLNRFDGEDFLHYTSDQHLRRLPVNNIIDLALSQDGELWLSMPSQLGRYDPLSGKFSPLDIDSIGALGGLPWSAHGLQMDRAGHLWFAVVSSQPGVARIQKVVEGKARQVARVNSKSNWVPILERGDRMLIGAANGEIVELSAAGEHLKTWKLPGATSHVTDLETDWQGNLWALLEDVQVFLLRKGATEFSKIPIGDNLFNGGAFTSILPEGENTLWLGGPAALYRIDLKEGVQKNLQGKVKELVKNTCHFRQITSDRAGNIWIATDFGLVKISRKQKLFDHYLSEGNEQCVNSFCSMRGIAEDAQGKIYFSFYNSIHVLEPESGEVKPLFSNHGFYNSPFGLLAHEGALWTGNGLRIDLATLRIDTILQTSRTDEGAVIADPFGKIWWGYQSQLFEYQPQIRKLSTFRDPTGKFPERETSISYLLQGRDQQTLWVGTNNNGLYKIDKSKGTLAHFSASPTSTARLSHNRVIAMLERPSGELWVATALGVNRLSPDGRLLQVYTTAEGLANDFINGILPEGDSVLWASTDNGLARLRIASGEVKNFYQQDGLSANEFNRVSFLRARNGRMYFGGLNGVNAFIPNASFWQPKPQSEAPLVLSEFSKYDGSLDSMFTLEWQSSLSGGANLSYQDRFFVFKFALLDYGEPASNLYSYRLDGFEKEWSRPSASNFARYNQIPAGHYTFRVRAAAAGSDWNAHELAVPVHIEAAFYKTWWFLSFLLVFTGGLVLGYFRWREYNHRRREMQLEQQVQLRTLELAQEKQKSENLLLNILPAETAEELKQFGKAKARRHEQVTVLFSDIKNFSKFAEKMDPEVLVAEIDHCFRHFDDIIEKYNLEKIKTIGDAYMCAGGLNEPDPTRKVSDVVAAAIEMQDFMLQVAEKKKATGDLFFEIRIGIHTGPVVAGIVGSKKFAYDIWGDTVNIASRMETMALPGKVNLTAETLQWLDSQYQHTHHGDFITKNGAEIKMYWVEKSGTQASAATKS